MQLTVYIGITSAIREALPIVLLFILGNLAYTFLISWHQWKLSRTQMKELNLAFDQGISIKLFTETFFKWQIGFTFPHRAMLYIGDQFIFIKPTPWDWYSGHYRTALPIVFTRDLAPIKALTKINNIYIPDSILPGQNGSVEIIFRNNPAITAKTHFYIDFCHKSERELLEPYLFKSQAWF